MGGGNSEEDMRKQNWPIILNEKIEEAKAAPFVWGVCDCLQFAGNVAAAMLDYDPHAKAEADLYKYDSEIGAYKMLAKHFDSKMGNVFGKVFEEISPAFAGRGDLAIVMFEGREVCGVVDSSGRHVACKALEGILFMPIKSAIAAWRVE